MNRKLVNHKCNNGRILLQAFLISYAFTVSFEKPLNPLDFAEKIDDTHFKGFKNVSADEEFFVGHFPVHPIVPGVLQMEAVRQLCVCFLPGTPADYRVVRMEKAKFRRQVLPGDKMRIDAELLSSDNGEFVFKASCSTASGSCSEVTMVFGAADELTGLQDIPALDGDYARTADIAVDTDQVMKLMPHRYPFLQIDYIAAAEGKAVAQRMFDHHIFPGAAYQIGPAEFRFGIIKIYRTGYKFMFHHQRRENQVEKRS
jgi:3-hydroxymyristoyl/3-hydroxydecanoyl-(acyl carrier protein) dehydratase